MNEENAIVKKENQSFIERLVADASSLDQIKEVGMVIIKSGFCPEHFKQSQDAVGAIMCIEAGRKLGLSWMQSLSDIYPVKGRIGIMGTAAKAVIFSSGILELWEETTEGEYPNPDYKHITISKRKGLPGTFRTEFSVYDAQVAGLMQKDIYKKYGKRMIAWRDIGFHASDYYQDILKGMKTVEELNDFEPLVPTPEQTIIKTADGSEVVVSGKDTGRSKKITGSVVDKIKVPEFAPVVDATPPPQYADPVMTTDEMPIYEGPHNIGPPIAQNPATPNEAYQKLTISQMSEMETEDLLKIIREDSDLSEAIMIVPGKNTNKKLREIIFAYQEGNLEEYLKPFAESYENTFEGRDPSDPTIPEVNTEEKEPELIQPKSSELNKYKIDVPAFDKGNERTFETKRELYHLLSGVGISNEKYLELVQALPQFAHYANKEAFCQYATISDVCELLNRF